jgi:conjugal transfer pilus assembly protein TraL
MTDDELSQRLEIPRKLDEPPKFLFWDFDIAMLFFVGISFGILTGSMLIGLGTGLGMAWLWQKTKSGKSKGFAIHWLYWRTGMPGFKRTPESARRDFLG